LHKEGESDAAAYRFLIAAVLKNAIAGLAGDAPDTAMAFFLSETCEAYCAECGVNYAVLLARAADIYRGVLERGESECGA
jgi:hypothetical protein